MNQVSWTEFTKNEFFHESGLVYRSELGSQKARLLISILKKHIVDKTNSEIADEMNLTTNKVDEYLRELKNMYDDVVYYTNKLIPRENLTSKDKEIQIQRYGFVLTIENLYNNKFYGR